MKNEIAYKGNGIKVHYILVGKVDPIKMLKYSVARNRLGPHNLYMVEPKQI